MKREFNIVIEQDENGYYVASVPELSCCHTQAKSLDKLQKHIIEAIELYIEVDKNRLEKSTKFVDIQKVGIIFEET